MFKRSGRRDPATPLTPGTEGSSPVFRGRQEGLDSATANNSRAQRRPPNITISSIPDASGYTVNDTHSVSGSYLSTFQGKNAINDREGFYGSTDPPNANTRTHRTQVQQQADVFKPNLSPTQALTAPEIPKLTINTRSVSHSRSSSLQSRNDEVHSQTRALTASEFHVQTINTRSLSHSRSSSLQRGSDEVHGREAFHSPRDPGRANFRTRGSHAPDQLDVFNSEYRPEKSPIVTHEQSQRSRNPASNDRTENINQYNRPLAPSGSPWTATQGTRPFSGSAKHNSFSEVLWPERSVYQGVKTTIDDYEASQYRFEKSETTQMESPEALHQELYHFGSTQSHVRNASRSQVFHTAVSVESAAIPDVMERQQSSTFFHNAQGVNISGNPNFQNNVTNVYGTETDGLKNLDGFISFDAQFDSSAQDSTRSCHPGTRQNVLKRMRDWVDNPNSTERIFWLYGPAGAGKSAIAQTIAHAYARPTVAATFFFFRSDLNRNDGNRLFTTLAYQLALSIPGIRDHIARSLYERPDLPRADIETQFKQLIARPFQALNRDATQQKLAPVVIIDGVDECTDENLQQRFLKIIGDVVKDNDFPLRFLISSRPEHHIEQTIRRFRSQTSIRSIDLAMLDDANRDIKKYLLHEFSRIASEQGLDPAWPGEKIIDDIVYKSSGNFIFASVVIKFVDDPYCLAKTQLDIVLNMKPPKITSPFAALDQLFLEILRRVPDQDFLKRYLAVLTTRISVSGRFGDLYKDDAVLMHVYEEELHGNLRRMRSLLRFEARIDVHHLSFLDFLHNPSRSGQYYVGKPGEIRRYLEVVIDSLVRYVLTSMEQSDQHNGPHFTPSFRAMIKDFPPKIELPINQWPEVIKPLLDLQDKLLQLPNFASTWQILRCDECSVFNLLRELIHLGLHLRYKGQTNDTSVQSVMNIRKRRGVISSTTTKAEKRNGNDLDSIPLSLFARLPTTMEGWSPNEEVIELMSNVLQPDSAVMAKSIRFVSDAQKLVDLLVYLIDEKNILSRIRPNATRKATLLALEIFARVPILPLTSFLHGNSRVHSGLERYVGFPIQILSQTIIASRVLDRHYIVPMWVIEDGTDGFVLVNGDADGNDLSMKQWRQRFKILSPLIPIQVMLGLAKAIQYFHSMGVVLHRGLCSDDVFLDSGLRPRICCLYSTSRFLLDRQCKETATFSREDNVFTFGCLFYELFSGIDTRPSLSTRERRGIISNRPPVLPEYAWQLIRRCCDEHPKTRPTINDVVDEMARWQIK